VMDLTVSIGSEVPPAVITIFFIASFYPFL
jgi:hypothetical protein